MYEIAYDAQSNILRYRVTGFWDMATLAMFQRDILAEVKRIKVSRENFDVLVDSTTFSVQAADVAAAISEMMVVATKLTQGRKAFAVGSMLSKLQAERMLSHPSVRIFLSLVEASTWLASPVENA